MIGMPRITLTMTIAVPESARTPETRISAQTRPSTVESTSEPTVTIMVSFTPNSRMGMNSTASTRKRCTFTSPRLRGEVDARSASGEGDSRRTEFVENPPHPTLSPHAGRGSPRPAGSSLQSPLRQDRLQPAVGLELGEAGIDLLEQLAVALAHADADRAEDGRLIGLDQPYVGKQALLQIVGEDRIVGEAGLEPPGVHVAQDVGDRVVDL